MKKPYEGKIYMGIDLGTDSCGWAVTDDKFRLIKVGGQHLWGIRLFDEAQTAKDRRAHRTQRKRIMRTRWRIQLLREIMTPLIEKKDPDFFHRLDYSSIFDWDHPDSPDRKPIRHFSLFNDPGFTDKEYFQRFPTIYHLRQYLMTTNDPNVDPRFVYLAFHNIIKYRGNFLDPNESSAGTNISEADVTEIFQAINDDLKALRSQEEEADETSEAESDDTDTTATEGDAPHFENNEKAAKAVKDLFNHSQQDSISELKEKLTPVINPKKNKQLAQAIALISGGTANGSVLFADDQFKEDKVFKSFSFEKYDEKIEPNLDQLDETQKDLIVQCKRLYDAKELIRIIGDHQYLSDSMVDRFNEHKKQLDWFKRFIKAYYKDEYSSIFRIPKDQKDGFPANYTHYIGSSQDGTKKITMGRSKPEDFYAFIKKKLKIDEQIKALKDKADKSQDDQEKLNGLEKINEYIEKENFLLRSHSGTNGVIKHQIHYKELEAIIDRLSQISPSYKAFFDQSDGQYTNRQKIESIFKFKIPYYVGPLDSNPNNKNHWAEKRSNEKIFPWNWEKIVDKKISAEKFIERMVSDCSYLPGAKALPRNSLLYEEFTTLNEINKIAIKKDKDDDNEKTAYLSQDLKDYVLSLYKKNGTLTLKQLQDELRKKTGIPKLQLVRPNGNAINKGDFELSSNMRSYGDFAKILGKPVDAKMEPMIEDMILSLTLFEDHEMLVEQLNDINVRYKSPLTKKQIEEVSNLHYQGWGKLSRELLEGIKGSYQDQPVSIIEMMRKVVKKNDNDFSYNLMELLFDNSLGFNKAIDDRKMEAVGTNYKGFRNYIENSYNSPMMKRAIIQAMAVIKEVEHILGRPADRYFLESTRSPDASKKGQNGNKWARINQLRASYEQLSKKLSDKGSLPKAFDDANKSLQSLIKGKNWLALRSKKLYLYFLQMGKDVYTGKSIPFEAVLNNTSEFDIDHIIPQSKVKDDSLNNMVLVSSVVNQQIKKDDYPLPESIRQAGKPTMQFLYRMGLMSKEKYDRLTRNTDLSDDELLGFVNRQLVSTSQSVKGLRDALMVEFTEQLKKRHPDWKPEEIERQLPLILYPKANNTSDFRRQFDIFKCREVNDFHHAHDAYLNIVVGDCYVEKFGFQPSKAQMEALHEDRKTWNCNKIFDYAIRSLSDRNSYVWIPAGEHKPEGTDRPTIELIKKQLNLLDILFTRKLKEQEGGLFDQTIYSPKELKSADDLSSYVSLKGSTNKDKRLKELSDLRKYGFYNKKSIAYLALISYEGKKGKTIYQIIGIPKLVNGKSLPNEKEYVSKYIESLPFKNPKVVLDHLLYNTICETFKVLPNKKENATRFSLTGKTGHNFWISSMTQPHTPWNIMYFCKLIAKYNQSKALTSKDGKSSAFKIEGNVLTFSSKDAKQVPNKASLSIEAPSYSQVQEINPAVIKAIYDYIIKQMRKPIYAQAPICNQFSKISQSLIEKESEVLSMEIEKQIALISNCLSEIQCRPSQGYDFSTIDGKPKMGGLSISAKVPNSFRIISQSVTGFYEKVIFELDDKGNRVK